jgi:hypothetical protein
VSALVDGARIVDLDAAIDAFGVQRVTLRRPPGGSWLALAVTPRHVEAVGSGSTLEAALIDLFRDVAALDGDAPAAVST